MLPNGVEVWYSRWKSLLPDGTCFEGVGIQPDIFVEHLQDFDPTFDKAVELLKSKTKNK
jgi:C-terminal processing protease CtpA/Prc